MRRSRAAARCSLSACCFRSSPAWCRAAHDEADPRAAGRRRAIGAGDLNQRIDVRTGDELQQLAEQFNKMAGELKESYAGLERKVEERTGELTENARAADRDLRDPARDQRLDDGVATRFDAIAKNCLRSLPVQPCGAGTGARGSHRGALSVGGASRAPTPTVGDGERGRGLARCIMEVQRDPPAGFAERCRRVSAAGEAARPNMDQGCSRP